MYERKKKMKMKIHPILLAIDHAFFVVLVILLLQQILMEKYPLPMICQHLLEFLPYPHVPIDH